MSSNNNNNNKNLLNDKILQLKISRNNNINIVNAVSITSAKKYNINNKNNNNNKNNYDNTSTIDYTVVDDDVQFDQQTNNRKKQHIDIKTSTTVTDDTVNNNNNNNNNNIHKPEIVHIIEEDYDNEQRLEQQQYYKQTNIEGGSSRQQLGSNNNNNNNNSRSLEELQNTILQLGNHNNNNSRSLEELQNNILHRKPGAHHVTTTTTTTTTTTNRISLQQQHCQPTQPSETIVRNNNNNHCLSLQQERNSTFDLSLNDDTTNHSSSGLVEAKPVILEVPKPVYEASEVKLEYQEQAPENDDESNQNKKNNHLILIVAAIIGGVLVITIVIGVTVAVLLTSNNDDDNNNNNNHVINEVVTNNSTTTSDTEVEPVTQYTGPTWLPKGSILYGQYALERSGLSVDLSKDGNTMVVGSMNAVGDDIQFMEGAGQFRVFNYNEDDKEWIQVGNVIRGLDEYDGMTDFHSLTISGDGSTIAAGSLHHNYVGHVRLFKRNNSNNEWVQVGNDIVEAREKNDSSSSSCIFGASVKLSYDGKTVAIRILSFDFGDNPGLAQVFRWNNKIEDWVQVGNNILGDYYTTNIGDTISLSPTGDTIAIGSPNVRAGEVSVYKWDGTIWDRIGNNVITGDNDGDNFGNFVSCSEDCTTIVCGALGPIIDPVIRNGYVRVFTLVNNNGTEWISKGDLIPAQQNHEDTPISISYDGNRVVIGLPDTDQGVANVYEWINNEWTLIGLPIVGMEDDRGYAYSVALSGDGSTLSVGAFRSNFVNTTANFTAVGRVEVFEWPLT